jgi:hypothetical protein
VFLSHFKASLGSGVESWISCVSLENWDLVAEAALAIDLAPEKW